MKTDKIRCPNCQAKDAQILEPITREAPYTSCRVICNACKVGWNSRSRYAVLLSIGFTNAAAELLRAS